MLLISKSIVDNARIQQTKVVNGIADLRDIDLEKQIVSLKGEWDFYPNKFLQPGQKSREKIHQNVPGSWKNHNQIGFGSYKLTVLLSGKNKLSTFGIYLNRVGSAYKLFIDGVDRGGNGIIGRNTDEEIPHRQTKLYVFDVSSDCSKIEIIIHVSNHNHTAGGIVSSVLFAEYRNLLSKTNNFLYVELFAGIMLLAISVITLSAYVFRQERDYLFYTVFICISFIYIIGTGENFLGSLFPGIPYSIFMKIIHLALGIHFILYNHLLAKYFPKEKIEILHKQVRNTSILFCLIVVVLPVRLFLVALPLYHIFNILYGLYWLFILFRAIRNKQSGSNITIFGVLVYKISIFIEIAYINQLAHNPRTVPIGYLGLVITFVINVTRVYAETYQMYIEAKEAELDEKDKKIEQLQYNLNDSDYLLAINKIKRNLNEICYIESHTYFCIAVLVSKEGEKTDIQLDTSLAKIIKQFGSQNQLVQCSRTHLVNPKKIISVRKSGKETFFDFDYGDLIKIGPVYMKKQKVKWVFSQINQKTEKAV